MSYQNVDSAVVHSSRTWACACSTIGRYMESGFLGWWGSTPRNRQSTSEYQTPPIRMCAARQALTSSTIRSLPAAVLAALKSDASLSKRQRPS